MNSAQQYSTKAQQFMKTAKKKLKGSFFGNLTSNKSERAEQAFELYKQAATNFKMAKLWDEAANAYLESIECDKICKGGQSAEMYVEAANVKERINTAQCVKLLELAISLNVQNNRIANVAKIQKRIAEIYQKDCEYTLSAGFYKQAAENYNTEQNRSSEYNACMLKIVDIGIYQANIDYAQLIHTLQEVADRYTKNKLTAPSAKEQYFRAILLFLANDDQIGANAALDKYTNNDPTFFQTRQHKFCSALIKSLKDKDRTLFSNECFKFNEIIPLDKWKTTILSKIQNLIPAQQQEKPKQKPIEKPTQKPIEKPIEKEQKTETPDNQNQEREDSDEL